MDDEDSADELFNKNTSRGKGKKPAASLPSDEEHSEEESEDVEDATDSEEDDENGEEEDGEQVDVIDDSEDGGDEKELEGAVGNAPTFPADWLSSDEDAEKCPICLNSFCDQPVATPENCAHYFCLDCIEEWARNANSCPVDRIVFNNILLRKGYGGTVQKTIVVKKKVDPAAEEEVGQLMEDTHCEACGGSDREDRMLLCDGCDAGYHMECLTPPLNAVPVEEWFCPQCAPNNHTTGQGRLSEDESSVFPTTSRSRPAQSRARRAIARTQHSERVRANVNRHRIMQARTAAQVAPQNLMQSTWLDETINAVLARLNTDGFSRELTTGPRSRRRHRTVRRRKTKKQGKAAGYKTSNRKVKTRKRKVRRRRRKRKEVVKKETTARGRIAQNLGLRKPTRGASIPSVYRPSDQSLRGMRAEIGAASLSIYGDAAVLSSGDEEAPDSHFTSLLDVKYRGLSRSALRSHQPVARPMTTGLSRNEHGISQMGVMAEPAPVQDLLGSILSGQTLLLMDSSDVIINRDGSLKPTKPVSLPSVRSSSSGSSALERTLSTEAASTPSSSPLTCSSNSSLRPCSTPVIPAASSPLIPNSPLSQMPVPSKPAGTGQSHRDTCGVRGQPPAKVTNRVSDSCLGERGNTSQQASAKKAPPKPVWVDVSALPRIPKIKRENTLTNGSTGSNSHTLPASSMTSLAGDKGRQYSVDQQGTSSSQQGRTMNLAQRTEKPGPSASFSNSFSSSSSASSMRSNSQPSSTVVSFRIGGSRNPWHARRLSVPTKDEESGKQKNKKMLLAAHSKAKKAPVKNEVYDPFDPTGSDSSENEAEEDKDNTGTLQSPSAVGKYKCPEQQIKTESMDLDSPVEEENPGIFAKVKQEPSSHKDDPWSLPSHQLTTHIKSRSLDTIEAYGVNPVTSDAECTGTSEMPITNTVAHSRSSSSSSHHSEKKIKMEVKIEPDSEESEDEDFKGNGFRHKLPTIADSSDASDRSKEREKRSPPFHSGSSSQSSSRSSEHSNKKKKHSHSEDKKQSHSSSPVRKESRSKHNERRRSQERKHYRDRGHSGESGRSRDPEHSQGRVRSRDGERSQELCDSPDRERPRERNHSRVVERSQELGHLPDRERPRERNHSRVVERSQELGHLADRERPRERNHSRVVERSQELGHLPDREHPQERNHPRVVERSQELGHLPDREHPRERNHSRVVERSQELGHLPDREHPQERNHPRVVERSQELGHLPDREHPRERNHSRVVERSQELGHLPDREHPRERNHSRVVERSQELGHLPDREHPQERNHPRVVERSQELGHLPDREHPRERNHSRVVERSQELGHLPDRERPRERNHSRVVERSQELGHLPDREHPRERNHSRVVERSQELGHLPDREHPRERNHSRVVERSQELGHLPDREHPRERTHSQDGERSHDSPDRERLRDQGRSRDEDHLRDCGRSRDGEHSRGRERSGDQRGLARSSSRESSREKNLKRERHEQNSSEREHQKRPKKKSSRSRSRSKERKKEGLSSERSSSGSRDREIKSTKVKSIISGDQRQKKDVPQGPQDKNDSPVKMEPLDSDDASVNDVCHDPATVESKQTNIEISSLTVEPKEENMEVEPLQTLWTVKQEPVDSSDEDITVDYLIDSLDFIKKEVKTDSETHPSGALEPQPVVSEAPITVKQESTTVGTGTKTPSQGKRVTWNIQEPEVSQPDKMSKLALFKIKLKQEGSRRAGSSASLRAASKDVAAAQEMSNPATTSLNPALPEGTSDFGQKRSCKEVEATIPQQKEKYLKKLHMQERAIEEVKLAIKPFYQKRDITKDEYKEILRKAVQKVCHSKSGEINPVKVANLVKAYVDKYKYARKHHKEEDSTEVESAENLNDPQTLTPFD
ncbi:PHD and RING finger domain-containing protein 1 [Trichomycterus rosablanca]|uniref:PHD and RING finger domain-containing protein 1 n=1 Tax=Trichomycterus rosablanca TaxID=2290929 RepID=UPI002F359580